MTTRTTIRTWMARALVALAVLALLGAGAAGVLLRSMGLLRAPVYDTRAPLLPSLARPALLVFHKTNGYIHRDAIAAANALFRELAQQHGLSVYLTDNGAVINAADLEKFDVVIWNNNTGDVLTPQQQSDFRHWLENGGKWLGLHGAGGDHFRWTWFVDEVVGARFSAHTLSPHFARAQLVFEQRDHPILAGLPDSLWLRDELYSFSDAPRARVSVLATLDESSYLEHQRWIADRLRMGDHPVIWWRRVGAGTAVYCALGHRAEIYALPAYRQLLDNALLWLIHGAPQTEP